MSEMNQRLLTIGVFYDGNFFSHINAYYHYNHPIARDLSIRGLHKFIKNYVATAEAVDVRYAQVVESHYFSGRLSAKVAEKWQKLYSDRALDEILMMEGVEQHHLPIKGRGEKGIDVWLAIEALEFAMLKRINIVALIAGDGDFVPLARKLTSLGVRVMVLGWDFKFMDEYQKERNTTTSPTLKDNCTYPVMMNELIDDNTKQNDPLINGLFHTTDKKTVACDKIAIDQKTPTIGKPAPDIDEFPPVEEQPTTSAQDYIEGVTLEPNAGFGFIKCDLYPENVFYHWSNLINRDFSDLQKNQRVRFLAEKGDRGYLAREVEVLE